MAKFKFDGKVLKDSKFVKIAEVEGNIIKDSKFKKVGEIEESKIKDAQFKKIAEFDGTTIKDAKFVKIGTISDVKKEIDGEGEDIILVALWLFFVRK